MDRVELRQQHEAFLIVRIGAGDDGDAFGRLAQVIGQMRHVGGDVEKVAGFGDEMMLEPLTIPHAGFAAEHVDRAFVVSHACAPWRARRAGS